MDDLLFSYFFLLLAGLVFVFVQAALRHEAGKYLDATASATMAAGYFNQASLFKFPELVLNGKGGGSGGGGGSGWAEEEWRGKREEGRVRGEEVRGRQEMNGERGGGEEEGGNVGGNGGGEGGLTGRGGLLEPCTTLVAGGGSVMLLMLVSMRQRYS